MNDNRHSPWLERARRVREGEPDLAYQPAEVSLTELQDLLDTILRHSVDGVVLCTEGGLYLEVSDSFCELTGYRRDELLGQTSITLGMVDPNGVRRIATTDARKKIKSRYANTIVRKDGTRRYVEFTQQFLGNGYTLVIVRDVTEFVEP